MHTILLVLSCVLVPALCQRTMWTVKNYPDPIDHPDRCGRIRPSFVCDPTNILQESAAVEIDEAVKAVYNQTKVPCYSSTPSTSRRKGYMIMVAVMPKMERFFTVNATGYSMQTRYREAQYFAYYLGKEYRWGKHSSMCNELIIIFYSAEDGVLYTSTQSTARRLVTDDIVQSAFMTTLTRYYPFNNSRRVGDAIKYLVNTYGDALREDLPSS